MIETDRRARGRASLERHSWTDTYDELSDAHREAPLEPADLERLAMTACLIGKDAECVETLTRAHQCYLSQDQPARAARCAFWIAFVLADLGKGAQAAGWVARAHRLLDAGSPDCVEAGYLRFLAALRCTAEGDHANAHTTFVEAAQIGERFADADLVSLARLGCGRTLIRLGDAARGIALLDEVMIGVTAGELSPLVAGSVYCGVISGCFDVFDLRRAREWTDALSRWCAAQPEVVAFRGECLVYRAEILRLQGVWPDALLEAERACASLAEPPDRPAAGAAFYQRAEIHRLRGDFAKAADAYRLASERGRSPHPGLALLWLAQGRVENAKAAICRVLDEARERRTRTRALVASVEILLAANDVPAARRSADELLEIASALDTPYLHAASAHGTGAVLLAEGDVRAALAALRDAWTLWRQIDAPYELARVHVLLGLACRELGDADTGAMEWDAARRVFQQLGAAPTLAHLETLAGTARSTTAGGLTARELQVLRLVAGGKTNRAIAGELTISEKTVARHLSNIFTKLDLTNRAAATAYAFQPQLVEQPLHTTPRRPAVGST